MANMKVQFEAEDWVRTEWMKSTFAEPFYRERLRLNAGGVFDFDAVNADKSIVATISTSGCRTSGGNHATGKMMKIRSDILFLLMVSAARRLVILTDKGMYEQCCKEKEQSGRLPRNIEFFHASLPAEMCIRLAESQRVAARE